MAYQTIDHQPLRPNSPRPKPRSKPPRKSPRRSSRSRLQISLVAGFILCLAVGLIALAVFFWMCTPAHAIDARTQPALALQPDRIAASLALMQLAGDPPDALANQALAAGHVDTAFAVAVYALDMQAPARRLLLLQTGRGFVEADRPAEATIALHAARSSVILNPHVNAIERHQSLTAVAGHFLAIDAADAARHTLAQVLATAAQTPGLLPAQRAEIFESVRPMARRAGDDLLAAQAAEYARNPFLTPDGMILPAQLAALVQASEPDPAVLQAVEQRRFAARLLAERIQLTGGMDIEPEQQALSIALTNEDTARAAVFRRALATEGLTFGARLGFLLEWRNWLALKARIAQQGFGLSLAPEWEENARFILQDLSTVHININTLVDAVSNEIEDPVDQSALRLEMLLELALLWELGLHPNGQAADLGQRMRVVQDELARLAHPPALPITYTGDDTGDGSPPGFRIRER